MLWICEHVGCLAQQRVVNLGVRLVALVPCGAKPVGGGGGGGVRRRAFSGGQSLDTGGRFMHNDGF